MKQLLRKKKYSLIFIFLKILNFNFTHKIIPCNKYNIEQFSYIYSRITTSTSNSSYWLKYVTTIHFNDVRKKKKSKCSYENCVHIPRHDNKVTRPCNLLTRELKLNGGQADFYSGTRRAHKADGIAGSKFEIFCRHFSSLRPRPLSLSLCFPFFHLPYTQSSDTRFNRDGCQGNLGTGVSHGLLKRLKGTAIPFRTGTIDEQWQANLFFCEVRTKMEIP